MTVSLVSDPSEAAEFGEVPLEAPELWIQMLEQGVLY